MSEAGRKQNRMDRASGILLPLFSLPSERGGGDMGPQAYRFIDRLSEAGQKFWQVLPLGPVNEKGCPYQSTSAFAGESGYISLEKLADQGILEGIETDMAKEEGLRIAYERSEAGAGDHDFDEFCSRESFWLDDFALFSALADRFGRDWSRWETGISSADPKAVEAWSRELAGEIRRHKWQQYIFFSQWEELLVYAHEKGIEIIGDVPYSAAYESADCWANRELFGIAEDGRQLMSAGAPPDYFTPEGQCWDNPLHNWQAHKDQGYSWWLDRIGRQFRLFDILRIDHMRGFESYYAIPSETRKPGEGHWEKGPGMDFFDAVNEKFGRDDFIAEDLGFLTEEVHQLIRDVGYPGMKVLQFAFDTGEENIYLPTNYDSDNSVVYTGTHDNDTTLGWYGHAEEWKKDFLTWYVRETLGGRGEDMGTYEPVVQAPKELQAEDAVRGMIQLAHSSRCKWSIIPMQDYLMLGSEARINTPGIADGNWCWQMEEGAFSEELAAEIADLCSAYGR